jgi:hypothetical protein
MTSDKCLHIKTLLQPQWPTSKLSASVLAKANISKIAIHRNKNAKTLTMCMAAAHYLLKKEQTAITVAL